MNRREDVNAIIEIRLEDGQDIEDVVARGEVTVSEAAFWQITEAILWRAGGTMTVEAAEAVEALTERFVMDATVAILNAERES